MAVVDVEVAVLEALSDHQGRQVAVDVIEIGQAQEDLAAERLQPATGVVGVVAQQVLADPIGPQRGPALGARILAFGADAADQGDAGRGGQKGVDQTGRVMGAFLTRANIV